MIAMLLCGCVTTLTASSIAFAQTRGNSGLPAGSGNPMADQQTQIAALQRQIAALPALAKDLETLQTQVSTLLALQTQVDELAKKVVVQANDLAGLRQDLSAVQGQMKTLGEMQTKLDTMATQAGLQAKRLDGLDIQVGGLLKQLDELKALKTDVTALNSQVAALSTLQKDFKTLRAQLDNLASQPTSGASSLSVYDKNGQRIGDVVGVDQEGVPYLGVKVGDSTVVLQVYPSQMVGLLLWFDGVNCTGNTYVSNPVLNTPSVFRFGAVLEPHGMVYAPAVPTPALVTVRLLSYKETTGVCSSFTTRTTAVPVSPVLDLDSLYQREYSVR